MTDWHLNFGMTEEPGTLLSWGFVKYIIKKVKKAFGRFIHRPEKFIFTIPIIGTVIKPFKRTYEIRGKRNIIDIINFLLEDEDDI